MRMLPFLNSCGNYQFVPARIFLYEIQGSQMYIDIGGEVYYTCPKLKNAV